MTTFSLKQISKELFDISPLQDAETQVVEEGLIFTKENTHLLISTEILNALDSSPHREDLQVFGITLRKKETGEFFTLHTLSLDSMKSRNTAIQILDRVAKEVFNTAPVVSDFSIL